MCQSFGLITGSVFSSWLKLYFLFKFYIKKTTSLLIRYFIHLILVMKQFRIISARETVLQVLRGQQIYLLAINLGNYSNERKALETIAVLSRSYSRVITGN